MARKKEAKDAVAPVALGDRAAAERALSELGGLYGRVKDREAALKAAVAALAKGFDEETAPLRRRIEALYEGLGHYAAEHRDELTEGGTRQSAVFPSGTMGWRKTPLSVKLKNVKRVLAALKALGLDRFIRIKEEVNKEAMLEELDVAAEVPGVELEQSEVFFVKPLTMEDEVSKDVLKKLKGKREKAA